jgi:hypothetical protein
MKSLFPPLGVVADIFIAAISAKDALLIFYRAIISPIIFDG